LPTLSAVCLSLAAISASLIHAATPSVLRIDANVIVARVSPLHAGLMTEEINHSFDGGVYAELLRDRALNGTLLPRANALGSWMLIGGTNGGSGMALDVSHPLSRAIPTSLRIDAASASLLNRVGVTNAGFWGIPVHPHTRYRVSFYGKAAGEFAGPLTVSLERADGSATFARTEVILSAGPWKEYEAILMTSDEACPTADARLVISTQQPGTFWLTLVSLFPPTWNDRPNGNRVDLMKKLAALRPKFLRFPGGGYLNYVDWKKTIGPLSDRPGVSNPWGYPSSQGMGYLEFLEWCEDLAMEPVLGVNAGYSGEDPREVVEAGPALQSFVQDALDQIEYATGDASTTWGAQRARDGHPAPFKLTYVEIGNEETDPAYDARFAQFYDAIKARYPGTQLIAAGQIKDTGSRPSEMDYRKSAQVKSRVPDALDEHFYKTAKDAFAAVGQFDDYDRRGPKIFVGEWATMEGPGPTPTLQAALGDAAWMIGMEHNSDLVIMQAYAPLLVNVNKGAFQWRTNLIGYDALNSYGSPSYYAQVMFNTHRGDEVLASSRHIAPDLFTSVTHESKTGTIYVKVVNASAMPQSVKIVIAGAAMIERQGKVIVLSGNPEDANSIQEPTKIVPVERPLRGTSAAFEHTFPQYSATVLELYSQKREQH